MTKSKAAEAVKPIMILTSASIILAVALVVILAATGDQGFGVTYTPKTVCNTYLQAKYQVSKQTGYKFRFILTIISAICLAFLVAYFIKANFRIGDISSLKISDIIVWSEIELILIYIGYSISLLSIIPLMIFYISILAEQGRCLGEIEGKQITLCILSIILFLMLLTCWILILINNDPALNQKQQNFHQSIKHNDLKEREIEMRNVFQDSQSIKPFKYNNNKNNKQELQTSLLVQNEPIPLFQSKNQKLQQQRRENDQEYNFPLEGNKFGEFMMQSVKPKTSKKGVNKQKAKTLKIIEQRKQRFRELNPFKKNQANPIEANEQSIQQVVEIPDQQNRMKNLPKQYMQYIRESKKKKRLPPTAQQINQMIKKNEKKNPQEFQDDQKKKQRIKDKINSLKQELMRRMEGQKKVEERQIQFIQENQQIIEEKIKNTQTYQQNEELFYYRPRMQKAPRKKKKKTLFDNEAYELAQLQAEGGQENKLIINKLKDKNTSKHKAIEPLANILKSQQKNQNKSRQDLMLQFLRKKYLQEQRQKPEQTYSGFPVQ